MNILIIDNSVAFTGAFKCALNEAELLKEAHNISFLLPSGSTLTPEVAKHGFRVYTLPLKEVSRSLKAMAVYPFALIRNLISLNKIIRKEQIEVVQINDFYNLLGALLKMAGYKGKVFTWVRFLPNGIPAPLRTLWTKAAVKYSDAVVAVSDAVLRQLPKQKHVVKIYDAVELTEQHSSIERGSNETVLFLYLANYTRGKGQEYAIEAFSKAYKQDQKIRMKFAGGDMGLEKNRQFRNELEMRIGELKVQDVVKVEGFVSDTEQEIKKADVLLNYSDGESFSMTCLEAGYYGRPVIATKCGGPEEIIADGQTGMLVNKGDTEAMAAAMLALAEDEEKRHEYGKNAKAYVRSKFSKKIFKRQLTEILGEPK